MKTFEVKYSVDGKPGFSTIVSAPNTAAARRVAMGTIQGMAGYAGKKITVTSVNEIR